MSVASPHSGGREGHGCSQVGPIRNTLFRFTLHCHENSLYYITKVVLLGTDISPRYINDGALFVCENELAACAGTDKYGIQSKETT
jgi:hypothetical protein